MKALLALWLAASGAGAVEPSGPRVILETPYGDIVLGLYADAAPRHTEQVLRLAGLGSYDTVSVHRVSPGRFLQLTSARNRRAPLTPEQSVGLRPVPLEAGLEHVRGALSMTRPENNANGAESSFSIMLGAAPHLDGRYTVFGRVESGWETVEAIESAPLDSNGKPVHRIEITRALVVPPERLAGRPKGRPWRAEDPWRPLAIQVMLLAIVAVALAARAAPSPNAGRSAAALAALLASVAFVASAFPGPLWAQVAALACVGGAAWALRGIDPAADLAPSPEAPPRAAPAPPAKTEAPPPPPIPIIRDNPFWPGDKK
ncbi:MAG: peptidylprolyl isomerase [Elusimicrobia bacterium]|nr:peptidylprolyl isomerase [Elusimicrobiota bacterium]